MFMTQIAHLADDNRGQVAFLVNEAIQPGARQHIAHHFLGYQA
jgi:hypothetical protein